MSGPQSHIYNDENLPVTHSCPSLCHHGSVHPWSPCHHRVVLFILRLTSRYFYNWHQSTSYSFSHTCQHQHKMLNIFPNTDILPKYYCRHEISGLQHKITLFICLFLSCKTVQNVTFNFAQQVECIKYVPRPRFKFLCS